jgi:hypothetical protein
MKEFHEVVTEMERTIFVCDEYVDEENICGRVRTLWDVRERASPKPNLPNLARAPVTHQKFRSGGFMVLATRFSIWLSGTAM